MSFDIVKSNDLVTQYCETLFQITACSFLPAPPNDYCYYHTLLPHYVHAPPLFHIIYGYAQI